MSNATTSTTVSIDEARLTRMVEQDKKALDASKANSKAKYGVSPSRPLGLTDEEIATTRRDDTIAIPKFQMDIKCRSCGAIHTRYTSDIFGKIVGDKPHSCKDCMKGAKSTRKDDDKEMRALMEKARKAGIPMMIGGKVNPAVLELA